MTAVPPVNKRRELTLGILFLVAATALTLGVGEIAIRVITSRRLVYNIEMVKYARELKQRDPRGVVSHVHRPSRSAKLMGVEIALNSLGRYMEAGIPCGIGTDSFPHNMLDELRMACYAGRILAGSYTAATTAQAFTVTARPSATPAAATDRRPVPLDSRASDASRPRFTSGSSSVVRSA